MPYVSRNQDDVIWGRWSTQQHDGQEWVDPSAQELAAIELMQEKAAAIVLAKQTREIILNRLTGISGRYQRAGDTAAALACDAAVQSLLGVFKLPAVTSAPDADTAKAAVLAAYYQIVAALQAVAPYAITAFEGIDQ